jgi:predicted transcriptional regulator
VHWAFPGLKKLGPAEIRVEIVLFRAEMATFQELLTKLSSSFTEDEIEHALKRLKRRGNVQSHWCGRDFVHALSEPRRKALIKKGDESRAHGGSS